MYCHQIYRESDADDYANPWIGCDRCSRWVHQKCEEANGHHWKQNKAYLCPDCRCITPESTATTVTTTSTPTTVNPGSQMGKSKSSKKNTGEIKKRRRTPCGSRNESPDSPVIVLPHHRAVQLSTFSPSTPMSPISPGSNFILFSKQHETKQNELPTTPTTTTTSLFDPNNNVMPCWNQLQSTIQNLPVVQPPVVAPPAPSSSKKRKMDTSTTTTTKKKSRTTTTITTTTTHRLNTAGIDALMGAVAEQRKEEVVPHLDLHITTTIKKGKQTSRKMNADARTAAIASSTDTPTTPTFFSPPLFATMTTTTTTVVPNADETAKSKASLGEEQFYQYQQLIMQQQNAQPTPIGGEDGEQSNDSSSSTVSSNSSTAAKPPATILQNTFGSVDKLGNFYGSFNEQAEKQSETSPYGMLVDEDEDFEAIASDKRRPQKRTRVSPPKKVTTTTTTLTMTTVSSAPVKSKRVRDRMAKNGGRRVVYTGTSSDTEDSDYEPAPSDSTSLRWKEAAKELNVSLDDAYSVLTNRFPKAPVLKKMGSLWAICEVIRVQEQL
jgi:hypothetical protein